MFVTAVTVAAATAFAATVSAIAIELGNALTLLLLPLVIVATHAVEFLLCSICKAKWIRYIKLIYLLNGWYCQSGWIVISQVSRSLYAGHGAQGGFNSFSTITRYCLNNSTESKKRACVLDFSNTANRIPVRVHVSGIAYVHCKTGNVTIVCIADAFSTHAVYQKSLTLVRILVYVIKRINW